MAEQDMQRIGMTEDDLAMQERRAKRSDQAAAFASWLNSMRMKPDANLPAQLQAAQERRASNIRKNRTVNMLESAGQTELAKQVKSGAITGKTAVAQMFQLAAEERQAQRAAAGRAATIQAQREAADLAFQRSKEMKVFEAALASGLPPKPLTQIAKLQADFDKGLISKDMFDAQVQAQLSKGKMGIRTNPDGTIEFVQGSDLPKYTEAQSKDINWALRMEGALKDFEPVASELTNVIGNLAQLDPTKLSRYAQSDDFQKAIVAGKEFLAPLVRKDTGAAVTNKEWELYSDIYIPQVGDGEAKLKQKAIARQRALDALKAGLPPQYVLNEQYAGRDPMAGRDAGAVQGVPDFSKMSTEDIQEFIAAEEAKQAEKR